MNLYEINSRIACFEPEIDEETGELLNGDLLDRLEMDRTQKIENICLFIKNLDADAAAIRAEEKELAARRGQKERKADSLRKYLETQLAGEEFETARCRVSYRKAASIEIDETFGAWARACAPELMRVSYAPDKTAIKARLKAGGEVVGAVIRETRSMQIK